MSTQTPATFAVGDLVTADPTLFSTSAGVVYKIVKAPRTAREVNYTAHPVDPATGDGIPGARGVKGPAYCFEAYDPDKPAEVIEFLPTPDLGALLRVTGAPGVPDGLYVATGYGTRPNTVKAAKLGGDGGRYWKAVGVKYVEVIAPDRVTIGE